MGPDILIHKGYNMSLIVGNTKLGKLWIMQHVKLEKGQHYFVQNELVEELISTFEEEDLIVEVK